MYQLHNFVKITLLGIRCCAYFPFLVGILYGLNLCRSYVCCHCRCKFIWASVLLRLGIAVSVELSGSYNLSFSLLHCSLIFKGKSGTKASHLGPSAPYSLKLSCVCVNYHYCRKLLWWGLRKAITYRNNDMSWNHSIAMFIQQNNSRFFP